MRKEHEKILRLKEAKLTALKAEGHDGYYQYQTVTILDNGSGNVNEYQITNTLNAYALDGWHLKTAYCNEVGRQSSSFGYGGISSGSNSTLDQHILIFEKFIKF